MTPWEKFKLDWTGKNVLIMGLGIQGGGVGDTQAFVQAGAHVTVTDLKSASQLSMSLAKLKGQPIRLVLGRHERADFISPDLIIRNPDVPQNNPYLELARGHRIPIKMDSSLFATYCPLPIIGVTGTRGKTTTTLMIYELLKTLFPEPVFLGGNIPGSATLELLHELNSATGAVVLELSSWELQGWYDEKISPHIAVFTNFSEDHLNRYESMSAYFSDKLTITQFQKPIDWLILNRDNSWSDQFAATTSAQVSWFSAKDLPDDIQLAIPGDHNRANAAAALAMAKIFNLDLDQALTILRGFRGVPFRLQTIAIIDGVKFVNDTTATTPTASIAALKSILSSVILLAGGADKRLNLEPFAQLIAAKVKAVILLEGTATANLQRAIIAAHGQTKLHGRFSQFSKAIRAAFKLAQAGDTVLLSPGCASFGMFRNEFDRGEQFNQIVNRLNHHDI